MYVTGRGQPASPQGLTGSLRPEPPAFQVKTLGVGCGLDPCDHKWPSAQARTCAQLLTLVSAECAVPKEPFLRSCQADLAACAQPGGQSCACATLSEYSRHCSLAGQPVRRWRSPGLCCECGCKGGGGPWGGPAPSPASARSPRTARRRRRWAGGRGLGCPTSSPAPPCARSPGAVPGQPGVPGVRRGLRQDLLPPAARLLRLLCLWLLLPGR